MDIPYTDEGAATRNTARTRRQILEATRVLLTEKGSGLTLAEVADQASVSKGGLLHHFPTRDALLLAALEDTNARFRTEVMEQLDLSENAPGKLLRAYVRTVCAARGAATGSLNTSTFWSGLNSVEGAAEISRIDEDRWRVDLVADGIDEVLARIVRRAAEGLAAAAAYGDETAADVEQAKDALIEMTLAPDALKPALHK